MSTEVKCPNLHPHSKTVSKTASLQARKMQNIATEKGDQLLNTLIRKRTQTHENVTHNKPPKDSKKKASVSSGQNQDGKKVLKENKCKSSTNSRLCFCSPTTHEGSFRCRLHRITAPQKSVAEKKTNERCSKFAQGIGEFKPQLSRFGRVVSAEFLDHTIA